MSGDTPTCDHTVRTPGSTLEFVAHYAAPGIGASYTCTACGAPFAVVGGAVHDPADGAHVLSPEDVI